MSASVDAELLEAASAAVAAGTAPSVSAWVSEAMRRHVEHEQRLAALGAFIDAFEAEHGVITDDEIAAATRSSRARAITVQKRPTSRVPKAHRRAG